jgi:hypothetical protein
MHDSSSKTTFTLFVADKISLDLTTLEKFRYRKIQLKGHWSKECNVESRNKVNLPSNSYRCWIEYLYKIIW